MTYKILNLNYLLKLFLHKYCLHRLNPQQIVRLVLSAIALLILWTNTIPSTQAANAPHIINGNTPDDTDEAPCSESELFDYVEKAKKIIASKWQPIKGFEDRNVVVIFSIGRNGKIEDSKIIEDSGSQAVDQSALEALKASSPLPALPALPKGAPDPIQIRYVFSWHVSRK